MQSKKGSLLESILNTGSGFLISYLTWVLIVEPIWGFELPVHEILSINIIYTVVSVARSYAWRRAFNYYITRSQND